MNKPDFQFGWHVLVKRSIPKHWSGPFIERGLAENAMAAAKEKYPKYNFELKPAISYSATVFQAGTRGRRRSSNPHSLGSEYHGVWDAGWGAKKAAS